MIFNQPVFVLFLVIVLILYWSPLTRDGAHKHPVLLAASYVFYGWWDWRYLALIIFCSLIAFFCGLGIHRARTSALRTLYLCISIIVPLAVLVAFKYYDFFITSLMAVFAAMGIDLHLHTLRVLLPVGISFYTFQALSYTIDIHRRQIEPTDQLVTFLAFKAFFPQLVAGPIERAPHFLPQIQARRPFSYANAMAGCRLMLIGAFKKMVLADRLAPLADAVFDHPTLFGGLFNGLGVIFFALQIYCDFSGYSDIARGVGKLFNLDLMVNFNRPYFARTLKDFWARWHISLSTWFRDYVYIPLGGNRLNALHSARNLMITFLLSGLWHGANWTFVIWGGLHGAFLLIERYAGTFLNQWHATLRWTLTMVIVLLGWVFFRAEDLPHALLYLERLFIFDAEQGYLLGRLLNYAESSPLGLLVTFLFSIALIVVDLLTARTTFWSIFQGRPMLRYAGYSGLVLAILFFGVFTDQRAFIYFQF